MEDEASGPTKKRKVTMKKKVLREHFEKRRAEKARRNLKKAMKGVMKKVIQKGPSPLHKLVSSLY